MTTSPNDAWMQQIARNLIDDEDGFLKDSRLLLMDRDTKFSAAFRHTLSLGGVHALRLPPKTPNLNAYVERFMRSIIARDCRSCSITTQRKELACKRMRMNE